MAAGIARRLGLDPLIVRVAFIATAAAGGVTRLVMWSVNGGLALFLIGLVAEVTVLKQIGAPVMGLALLWGIYAYYRQMGSAPVAATT